MVSFVEYLAALSVKDVLKLCADRSFISHSVLRKVQDHIAVRIVRGENIDAEDRASYDRLQTQVGLRGGDDASVALNTVPTQKSAALDVSTRPLSAVSEPLQDPPSFSAEISDDDLDVLMNIIEQCEADASVALNVMPAPKSRALEAPARPHADVSDPMLRAAPFSPEINDDDLDMLMNIIDEELGYDDNTTKSDESVVLNQKQLPRGTIPSDTEAKVQSHLGFSRTKIFVILVMNWIRKKKKICNKRG